MKKALFTPLLALAFGLAITAPANAGLDEGVAAYGTGNYTIALREFLPLAKKGDAAAQYNLGLIYSNGRGVAQDDREAANWFRKAAMQGNASAQYNLGVVYSNGLGVAQDDREAANWYRKAAIQGDAKAQYNLGVNYANGNGVAKNYIQAYALFNTAAVTHEGARKSRSVLTKMMTPTQIEAGQALTRRIQAVGIDKALD